MVPRGETGHLSHEGLVQSSSQWPLARPLSGAPNWRIRKDDQRAGAVIDRMRGFLKWREVQRDRLDTNLLVLARRRFP